MTIGVKQIDISPCAACGKGLMHDNQILCTRIVVTRLAANLRAIERQAGLEMMLGGNVEIAHVMGEQADMLVPLDEEATVFLCDSCARHRRVCELHELAENPAPDDRDRARIAAGRREELQRELSK